MLRRWRLRKVHAKFLQACRNLREGNDYWVGAGSIRKWFVETIVPVPLLSLHEGGKVLLDALQWLEANCRTRRLGEDVVQQYHRIIYHENPEAAGMYRKHDLVMKDSEIKRRTAQKVRPMMNLLDRRVQQEQERFDSMIPVDGAAVLKVAVEVHHQIGLIHPFEDANGRVARLSMNHLLRRYNLGYVIYPPLSEKKFWNALQAAHRGDAEQLVSFAKQCQHWV